MLQALKSRYPSPPRWLFGAAAALALGFLLLTYYRVWSPQYGITRLIQIGTVFDQRGLAVYRATPKYMDPYPPDRWGFDGQYYAELSLDPLLRDPQIKVALDDPPYRARRILLPWIAHVLGMGHPWATINIYAALNLLFWLPYVAILYFLFRGKGWRGWAGFCALLLTCGIIECMKGSLTDFPAFVLMTAGLALGGWAGACCLGLAGLTREVSIIATAGLYRYRPPWGRAFWRNVGLSLVAGGPMALWWAYIWWKLRMHTHGDTDNIDLPFRGMAQKFVEVVGMARRGEIHWLQAYKNEYVHAILTMIAVVTQSAYLLTHREWTNRFWRVGAIFIPFFFVISHQQWESHFTITRQALPITLAFNLILALRPTRRWLLWFVLGNCFVPYGISLFHSIGRQVPHMPEVTYVGLPQTGDALTVRYGEGWSGGEWNAQKSWRWAVQKQATLVVANAEKHPQRIALNFTTTSISPRTLRIRAQGKDIWLGQINPDPRTGERLYTPVRTLPVTLPPGETKFEFATPQPLDTAGNDPRTLAFMVAGLEVIALPPAAP
ncbi:MAG TPA: hypothetical protein VHC86_07965 [Opitutaceae bacterium]|nr:hypothetical protein [Opitutaceae bacterium]